MGIKKSSSFTGTCFKLSEMWSALCLLLKIKDFLKVFMDFILMFIVNTQTVDCWLSAKDFYKNHSLNAIKF